MRNRVTTLMCAAFLALASTLLATGENSSAEKQTPPPGGPPKPFHLPEMRIFSLPCIPDRTIPSQLQCEGASQEVERVSLRLRVLCL
jgi:hypothetical protein